MCGIVSVIRKDTKKTLYKKETDIFKQMLYADALRGWDSTGIATVNNQGKVKVIKDACSPATLFFRNPEQEWIHGNAALIGHNRSATRGKTTKENAHPFTEGHITLVHNGTLHFHHHLKAVEVDSHAITHSIAERGNKDTLEMLQGAYALVWYDEKTNLIHAARNKERPLYLLETEELFLLASEFELAEWICARNAVNIKRVQLLTEDLIYTFKPNKKGFRYIDTLRITPFKVKQEPLRQTLSNKVTPITGQFCKPVSQIHPYGDKENFEGLVVGQSVDVLVHLQKNLSYSCFGLGKNRWIAEVIEHPALAVEIYTDSEENFEGSTVNIKINRLYFSPGLQQNFLIGENPIIPQKKTADANGPMRTSNGIEVTDQVIAQCQDKCCEGCSSDFKPEPDMTLQPVILNGHTYGYRYTCPECTDYFNLQQGHV